MLTDEILVKNALSGDKDAFGKLVEKYSSAVYGLAYHLVGNFSDAQDLAQKTFITAYLKLHQLKDYAKFAGWLRIITINTCKMWLRKQKEKIISIGKIDESKIISTQASPEDELIAKEERDMVTRAMASLSEKCRLALTLHYMDGMAYEEMAKFLEITPSAVDSRLQRARKKLRHEVFKMMEKEFREHKLPENFTDKVIIELLAKPKLLDVPGHPLQKIWEYIKASLPDYTVVKAGSEIELIQDNYGIMDSSLDKKVFHVDNERMLRVHTTTTLVNQLSKYKSPIKLLTAGRAFRRCEEDATHYPVFHQVEGLCVGEGITESDLKETVRKVVCDIFGGVEIRFHPHNWPFTDPGWTVEVETKGNWLEILGVGIYKKRILQKAGHDPEIVSGFGFGMGIERLAMIKYGVDDIRTFWQE